jgi:hypothetical protein
MNVDEIKRLPTGEKIQIMEAIWGDFRDRFDRFEISSADQTVLDERRKRVSIGTSQVREWDAVKTRLGRNDRR